MSSAPSCNVFFATSKVLTKLVSWGVSPVQYTARTSDSDLGLSDGIKVRRGKLVK